MQIYFIGIHGEAVGELADLTREQFGITAPSGVLVTEIYRSAPAFEAGLRPGDVILKMNGRDVNHPSEMDFVNWDLFVGDEVVLDALREGRPETIRFQVVELDQ